MHRERVLDVLCADELECQLAHPMSLNSCRQTQIPIDALLVAERLEVWLWHPAKLVKPAQVFQ